MAVIVMLISVHVRILIVVMISMQPSRVSALTERRGRAVGAGDDEDSAAVEAEAEEEDPRSEGGGEADEKFGSLQHPARRPGPSPSLPPPPLRPLAPLTARVVGPGGKRQVLRVRERFAVRGTRAPEEEAQKGACLVYPEPP
eukprot:2555469-Rhodomonas_salina.1